jgi:hypothetical protein
MSPIPYRDPNGNYALALADGWTVEADGEGGALIFREEGFGLLHLMPFERESDEEPDPAEELYAFLADHDLELEEDEVVDIDIGPTGSLAVCEYLAEEPEEVVYWLVGVATTPGRLLFASYSCASADREHEREAVREMLGTLRFPRE